MNSDGITLQTQTVDTGQNEDNKLLETLNKYFKAWPYEKHPEAMLNYFINESCKEVLGMNFAKERVSQRKSKKIYDMILEKMQEKYGKWVNVTHWKMKTLDCIKFGTNFKRVYNTEKGKLYGTAYKSLWGSVLVTAHCLERFEERIDMDLCMPVYERYRKFLKTEPTAAELLTALMVSCDWEYAPLAPNEFYMNVKVGALIVDTYDDISVVKTYLTPDMVKNVQWYAPTLTEMQRRRPSEHFKSLKELMSHDYRKIEKPNFLTWDSLNELLHIEEEDSDE